MKFDAKMARYLANFYNDEVYYNWDTIIGTIFGESIKGNHSFSTTTDDYGKFWFNTICKKKERLIRLGFKVEIDEDAKTAIISW